MVKSHNSNALFWGSGLLVFGTHRLEQAPHDHMAACRVLPTLEALQYCGKWKDKWATRSTNHTPRKMVKLVKRVAEQELMAQVGTLNSEVALALCTDARLQAEDGFIGPDKNKFFGELTDQMRWSRGLDGEDT
jgi:hypothetical protein